MVNINGSEGVCLLSQNLSPGSTWINVVVVLLVHTTYGLDCEWGSILLQTFLAQLDLLAPSLLGLPNDYRREPGVDLQGLTPTASKYCRSSVSPFSLRGFVLLDNSEAVSWFEEEWLFFVCQVTIDDGRTRIISNIWALRQKMIARSLKRGWRTIMNTTSRSFCV